MMSLDHHQDGITVDIISQWKHEDTLREVSSKLVNIRLSFMFIMKNTNTLISSKQESMLTNQEVCFFRRLLSTLSRIFDNQDFEGR